MIPPPAAYASMLALTSVPLAIWCMLSSAEVIAIRHAYHPGRPLGVDLGALSTERIRPAIFASPLCSPPALLIVPMARLAAGAALPILAAWGPSAMLLAVLAVIAGCTAWLSIPMRGSDGADKIAIVVCTGAALIAAGQLAGDRWLCLAGLAWIAGQVTIAYVTSGVAKLTRPFWRNGSAIAAALTSHQSGHAFAATIMRHRPAAIALSWAVMLVEALFPLACLSALATVALLAAMAAFHVATAILMGLNTYPWAFVATYPGVMMASGMVRAIGHG